MSELEKRFEAWWTQESDRFFAGHEVDGWMYTACKVAWMNSAKVQADLLMDADVKEQG